MTEKYPHKYKWLQVIRAKDRPWVNASYSKRKKTIYLYDNWFRLNAYRKESVLIHEWGHHIFFKLPKLYRLVWKFISNGRLIKLLSFFWIIHYNKNSYINNHAKDSHLEDFSECLEFAYLREKDDKSKFNPCVEFKIKIATSLRDNYEVAAK